VELEEASSEENKNNAVKDVTPSAPTVRTSNEDQPFLAPNPAVQRQSTGARQQKVGAKEAIHKAMLDEKRATDERETSKKRSLDEDAEELLAEKKGNLKKAKLRDEFRTRSSVHSAILSRREITKAKAEIFCMIASACCRESMLGNEREK